MTPPNRPPRGPRFGRGGKANAPSASKPATKASEQPPAKPSGGPSEPRPSPMKQSSSTKVAATTDQPGDQGNEAQKKKRHRGTRHKRNRRQSFAVPAEDGLQERSQSTNDVRDPATSSRPGFYRLGQSGVNLSSTSLESEALLDHRDQQSLQPRRQSVMNQSSFGPRPTGTGRTQSSNSNQRGSYQSPVTGEPQRRGARHQPSYSHQQLPEGSDEEREATDRTPLIPSGKRERRDSGRSIFGVFGGRQSSQDRHDNRRDLSTPSSTSSRRKKRAPLQSSSAPAGDYDINNPPSVPSSPKIGPEVGYGDPLVTGDFAPARYPEASRGMGPMGRDSVINIDENAMADQTGPRSSPPTPTPEEEATRHRRRTVALPAEGDVCFPIDTLSEIAEDDTPTLAGSTQRSGPRRRRGREWPDLSVLDDWSREEKEERSEGIRAKKISEPVLVGGRLRPVKAGWHRTEEDLPYRFTYFNEEFQSTIHSQTISELLQPGQSFRELFIPDPPELSEDESDEDEDLMSHQDLSDGHRYGSTTNGDSKGDLSQVSNGGHSKQEPRTSSGDATPVQAQPGLKKNGQQKRQGARPTFWLDVLSPTDAEMRVISKTFGIHPLTAEDIMMQEAREKVELFRNYYFVNYRTFEQDLNSEDFLEPIDMYVVVFREGVISFHFSMIPHPANVRRRIRQLKDYLILSSDWISYAIIDDITDAFAPLIQSIEDEVDDIDDAILQLHSPSDDTKTSSTHPKTPGTSEKKSEASDMTSADKGGDMLRRVGDCRKKVMGLYRLLGNKADVIKGFAKRCNEQWDIAPRSEIGLYLGDIQDHIITMTSNLSHYEKILSRSHSNYLAQINIRMNERQEQTADVLGRLTVLGTIVLPMNIITGLWGMNCLVPGQDGSNLTWFWSITAGLLVFGFMCYFIAKRVYGIV
ncbi:MAG: CorA metal ion transporter [Caeruleum heppii]|nr:MAG: CorA metal ion transporter [Caeruleum heppii]